MSEVKHADPSALGLFGLSMVTFVASSQKLGITDGVSYVIPWAIMLGGIAQIIAGILDYKKLNIFGATAFSSYGLFWMAVGFAWMINLGVFGEQMQLTVDPKQLGFAFLGYFIFSIFLTIGAMETNFALFLAFVGVDLLLLGLFLSSFGVAPAFFAKLAAYSEFGVAIVGFYGAGANVLNNHFGKTFLPVGKPFGIFK